MPDGKTHIKLWGLFWPIAICLAVVFGSVIYQFTGSIVFGLILTGTTLLGYLMGCMIDPDWDEIGITDGEGRMIKIPVIGVLVYGFSSVYGAIFRRHHRSFFTHFPCVSTAIRLLFVFF